MESSTSVQTVTARDVVGTAAPVGVASTADGRTARRDRNRNAVVDALLELYGEDNVMPSSDEIAARSGLSPRSLFRYFDDLDDLARAAVDRQFARVTPLASIDTSPDAPLPERVARIVDSRLRTYEFVAPVAKVARWRAMVQQIIAEQVEYSRQLLREQVANLFAPELAGLGASGRHVMSAVDVLLSFESVTHMRESQGLEPEAVRITLASAIESLLAGTRRESVH